MYFLLGNYLMSEFYILRFRNTLSHLHKCVDLPAYEDGTHSVPKRRHIKFRRRGITQNKAYDIQNMAKVRSEGKMLYAFFWEIP